MATAPAGNWIVNPSELAALYEECSRCLYHHVRGHADVHPAKPPAVHTVNDAMSAAQTQQTWLELSGVPRFKVKHHRFAIGSAPFTFPGTETTLTFHGEVDAILETASGQLVLAKYALTTDADDSTYRYQRELAGFTYALEHPDTPATPPLRISAHAVLGFSAMPAQRRGNEKVWMPARWTDLERRADSFQSFMRVVARMLSAPHAPPASPKCPRCHKQRAEGGGDSNRLAS